MYTYVPRHNKATEGDYKGPLAQAINALVIGEHQYYRSVCQ